MSEQLTLPAISDITDPADIRVVLFINNQLIHAPLPALIKHLVEEIDALKTRVTDLETP